MAAKISFRVANKVSCDRSPRRRVALTGEISSTTGGYKLKLRNLSRTGAMAEGESVPPAGRDILLIVGSLELFCKVIWADAGRCGLQFDEPIPQSLVLSLSRAVPDGSEERRAAELAAEAWARPQGRQAFLD